MRTKHAVRGLAVGAVVAVIGVAGTGNAQQQRPMSDQEMIASAMQAAPRPVAEAATVVAMGADGAMRTLRPGTNGWTCMADNPISPGTDPMCLDANAMEWAHAWLGRKPPPDKVGFVFMLAGGSDASNTDPYATGPAPGNNWIETGPHVMIVGPAARTMQGYSREPTPDTARPYVMWAGTPYEHLMIPCAEGTAPASKPKRKRAVLLA